MIFIIGTLNTMNTQKGFTLVEVLVAIGLFSIIVAIAAGGFITALRTQRQVAALIEAQSNASLAIEQLAREARTGYLFCHDAGGTGDGNCDATGPANTYSNLDFYTAEGEHVCYSLVGGELQRSSGGGCASGTGQSVTGENVSVKYLQFIVIGNQEDDHWNPRITILMGIAPSSSDPTLESDVLNLQTTVSARTIDCNAFGC